MRAGRGLVNKASNSMWSSSGGDMSTAAHDMMNVMAWVGTASWAAPRHQHHHVYRTLLRLIVSVDHPPCSVIGLSMCLTPVRMDRLHNRLQLLYYEVTKCTLYLYMRVKL